MLISINFNADLYFVFFFSVTMKISVVIRLMIVGPQEILTWTGALVCADNPQLIDTHRTKNKNKTHTTYLTMEKKIENHLLQAIETEVKG